MGDTIDNVRTVILHAAAGVSNRPAATTSTSSDITFQLPTPVTRPSDTTWGEEGKPQYVMLSKFYAGTHPANTVGVPRAYPFFYIVSNLPTNVSAPTAGGGVISNILGVVHSPGINIALAENTIPRYEALQAATKSAMLRTSYTQISQLRIQLLDAAGNPMTWLNATAHNWLIELKFI